MARFVLDRSKVILFIVAVLALLGVRAYFGAPQSIFPRMTFARIDVVADAGDLTPERVRIAVTRPLETALGSLPSATRVRATSSQGSADVEIDFDPRTDPRVDLQYAQAAIATLQPSLPAAKRIDAVIVNPNAEPVVSYGLTSRALSQAALQQYVETRVLPAFAGTPGLGRTSVVGGPPVEYRVELAPGALAAVGLSAADVTAAIADANTVQSVGSADHFHQHYVLLIDANVHDARSLATIGIPLKAGGAIALGTLGTVRLGVGPATVQASVNGTHAVILNAFALAGADAVTLAATFDARLAHVRGALPADVAVTKYWDQTRLIRNSQRSLRDAILLGALLAVIVIYLFLRSLRMTLVAAAIIPLAMAIAILVLVQSGESLNLMSVGGLAIAVGLIIDDAIVVIEAIARRVALAPDEPRERSIATAAGRIAGAMAASTATTVVVFVPLGFLTGVTGFFFRSLAFTIAVSLVVSLALALGVAPALARALLRGAPAHVERADALQQRYAPILRWALAHRAAVFAGAAVVLATTVLLLLRLPSDFLPKLDEGEFEIKYTLPAGATLAASDAAAHRMEEIVRRDPDVVDVGRLTGIDTNGFSPTLPATGTLRIALRTGNRASYDAISGRLRDQLTAAIPAANLDFHQLLEDQINDLSGTPSPIEIVLAGPDQQRLIALADTMTAAIGHVPGVVDGFDGVVYDDPALRVVPRATQLAALGMTASDVADAMTARAQGVTATQLATGAVQIPVQVRVAGSTPDIDALGDAALFTKSGVVALGALAGVDHAGRASDVNEENGRRLIRVTANIEGASLSAVIAGIKSQIARLGIPPGYTATIGGTYETQQASFNEFAAVIAIAIVLVFTVMLATFGSFRMPLVILCAIPLALIGVALGLAVTRTPFNVSSFMGLLLLVGIVVKNGILLIDAANERRAAGDDMTEALVAAGATRVRPIVMTTLAAIGGLFPLALGLGAGAAMERPLAIAVIGGLSTATAFTLVLIPVLYATFIDGDRRRSGAAVAAVTGAFVFVACLAGMPQPASAQSASAPVLAERFAQIDLAAAESLALLASPDVRAAVAARNGSRAAVDVARGANGFSVVGGYSELPQGAPGGQVAQRYTSVGGQVTLGDVYGYVPLVAQAGATLRAAETGVLVAERMERTKTIGLYFGALRARAALRARVDAVALARAQLHAAQIRFNAGDAPRLDIVRAQVALARAQGDAANARAADGNATDALAREVARPVSAFAETSHVVLSRSDNVTAQHPEADAQAEFVAAAVLDPDVAVAQALAVRADVRSAQSDVDAARAGTAAATRAFIPPVTLGAGYATGVDSGYPINGPTLSATVAIPLSGVDAAKVHQQAALVDAAIARRDGTVRAVALEVGAAARNAQAARDALAAADGALNAAQAELAAATLGYTSGAVSSLDLVSARSTYVGAEVDAISARFDQLQAEATLQLEVGP